MKNKMFFLFFIFPFTIQAQNAELEFIEPVKNSSHKGKIYGNEETGYIRISTVGDNMIITSIDEEDFSSNETKAYNEPYSKVSLVIKLSKSKIKIISFDEKDYVEEKVVDFTPHINMGERFMSKMKMVHSIHYIKILDDNSKIFIYRLDVNPLYSNGTFANEYRNYLIVKTNVYGEIIFAKQIPTRGSMNTYNNKFYFSANVDKVNVVFMDNLDNNLINGVEYKGDYIRAQSIDNKGKIITNKIWKGFKNDNYKFKNALLNGNFFDVNTFYSPILKKKKEEIALKIIFED